MGKYAYFLLMYLFFQLRTVASRKCPVLPWVAFIYFFITFTLTHCHRISYCHYPVVVGSVRVLVASDDLRGHPVRRPDEGVPPSYCAVQLSTYTEVHWENETLKSISAAWLKRSNPDGSVCMFGLCSSANGQ